MSNEKQNTQKQKLPDVFVVINIEVRLQEAGHKTQKPGPIKKLLDQAYDLMRRDLVQAALEVVEQLKDYL